MIQITKKGAVLVVVIMITLILSLLATGLFVVIANETNLPTQDFEETKLRFAAEGGVKALYHNLCRLNSTDIAKANSDNKIGNGKTITINGYTVNLFAIKDATLPIWKIWASATSSGKICEVSISNIIANSVMEKSMAITESMDGTGNFIGSVKKNTLERGDNVNHFRGKTYFAGQINVGGVPWFEGDCICTGGVASKQEGPANNGGTKWLTDINNLKYKGIYDRSYVDKWAGDAYGTDGASYATAANMEARFNKMFENGSYTMSDAPVDFAKSNYTWEELNQTKPPNGLRVLKIPQPSSSSTIKVEFKVDNAGIKTADISGAVTQTVNLANYDIITIATKNTATTANADIQTVEVKGVIDSDITLAVDYGVVKLTGDLLYKGFETDYASMTKSELVSGTKLENLNTKLKNGSYGEFGLINYNGHVLVDGIANAANATGSATVASSDNALLFMGVIYAPNGQFGSTANSTKDLLYNRYGNASPSNDIPQGYLQVVTIGSIIAKGKAYFNKGTTSGMAAHFCPDPRFEAGHKPTGFPGTVKTITLGTDKYDFSQFATSEMIWKIEWK